MGTRTGRLPFQNILLTREYKWQPVSLTRYLECHSEKAGGIAEEYKTQPIHHILRPNQLLTSVDETVQVTVIKIQGI